MSILGNRVVRREDQKFLTSGGTYVDDLPLRDAAYVTYVRSTIAHARIGSIDVNEASAAPGVLTVITGADVDLAPVPPVFPMMNAAMVRPWLATDKVRFVGEPLAAIVSETRAQGVDATELVSVDYEPLDAVVDLEAAEHGALLFDDAGNNVAFDVSEMMGFVPTDDFFDGCDVVVRQRIVNQRVAPCPLEVRAAAAAWGDDGRLTHWGSTQTPNGLQGQIAGAFGLDPSQVRVIAPDVGGGFGAKGAFYPEEQLLGWIAKRIGRPVRWVEARSESMLTLGHGRGQVQYVELGGSRDGTLLALRVVVLQDCGAYPALGALLPMMTRMMASGTYDIAKVEFGAKSLVTTTCPTVAYRGAGRPEATAAIERTVDVFAAEIGMDPGALRRRNLVRADQFPFTSPTGTSYDSGNYGQALDLVLQSAGYEALRAEQAERRARHDVHQLGIGISTYVEITNPLPGGEYGGVEITPAGKAIVRAGTFSHGQGHATTFAMLVSDRLGIDLDDIEFVQGDTDQIRSGQGTVGSRSLQTAGPALREASALVIEQGRELAAQLLEASPDDIVLDPVAGAFHVAGTPSMTRTWADVAGEAGPEGLRADIDFEPFGPSFPFGAHVAVVDVDTETGEVRLERLIAVDDSGTILNPLITEGQRHGGIAQGVAQALMEEMRYDDDGNPLTSTLAEYAMISACELPSFELVPMETPTPLNELGAKGIGESGTIGATPAVQNAVVDALSHFGVRHIDMPLTPERVWRAIVDVE
ncbi:MAG TPA: xanthine dehydrogenase family protein molybdopterin-binding subunit [Acidimicrobiia bacterium]